MNHSTAQISMRVDEGRKGYSLLAIKKKVCIVVRRAKKKPTW